MLSLWRVHCFLIFNLLSRTSPVFSYGLAALPVCPQSVHLLQVCPSYLQHFVKCCEVLVGPYPTCWAPCHSPSGFHCTGCFTQGGVSLLRLHSMSLPKFLMMTDSISPGINCWETLLVNRLLKSVDSPSEPSSAANFPLILESAHGSSLRSLAPGGDIGNHIKMSAKV